MNLGASIAVQRRFASLDVAEIGLVARAVAATQRLGLVRVARTATRLGNGWLYPIVALFLVAARVENSFRFFISAAVSLLFAFALYPGLKTFIARARPCDYDRSLARDPEPLDHYSCPSGHAMTAAAFGVPLMLADPAGAPLALAICGVVSWSRVALGHHYVSDVILGTLLGGGVAGLVATVIY